MSMNETTPVTRDKRRYDAWIWLDGLQDFSKPTKKLTFYSAGDGTDVLVSLQKHYGAKAIISIRNEEDANKIREVTEPPKPDVT